MIQTLLLGKRILLFLFIICFVQCSTIKKDNAHLEHFISVNQLQKDIDFTQKKFEKLHPKLYYYISKENLDYKFDSLKTTINKPLTPLEFYKKISPVVAAIKQGHSYALPPSKAYSKKQTKAIIKKGIGPFSQFDFSFYKNKLYIIKNKSYTKNIPLGSEVLTVNGIKPANLIKEYSSYFSSDGFNTTFKNQMASKRFTSFFTTEYGIKDSLHYVLKYNDSIQHITIRRFKEDSIDKKTKKNIPEISRMDKAKQQELKRKKRINGYDKSTDVFIRNLDFIAKDSSVAFLKIRGFKDGNFRKFYKETFAEIKKQNAKMLIIDLRNNGGGSLNEIVDLYCYLADSSFVFLEKSEVVSRASLFYGGYFNGGSIVVKGIKTLFSPFVYAYLLATVHKDKNGKNYFATQNKPKYINKNAFGGKICVLINGGSFSASSLISSNLKGSKRATFVGEETGGDYNGTVAGFMPILKMPYSKLKVRIGIMNMVPYNQTKILGHGIFPDVSISPTLENQIQDTDPELNWIVKQIK